MDRVFPALVLWPMLSPDALIEIMVMKSCGRSTMVCCTWASGMCFKGILVVDLDVTARKFLFECMEDSIVALALSIVLVLLMAW